MTCYQYEPLDKDAHEIRLLYLLPSIKFESVLRAQIKKLVLTKDAPPQYEALSYVWGSKANPLKIQIGRGKVRTLDITQNLAIALQHLRFHSKPRILWVDAICVNQEDNEERSRQVLRMAEIYQLAHTVVAWIGPHADDSDTALRLLESCASLVDFDATRNTFSPVSYSKESLALAHYDAPPPMRVRQKEQYALAMLYNRPWFHRLWIRQEVVLANRRAILLCGSSSLAWESFRIGAIVVQWKLFDVTALADSVAKVYYRNIALVGDLVQLKTMVPLSLANAIRMTEHCKCSDSRDRVFALLDMLHSKEKAGIRPNYTLSPVDVYKAAVLHLLRNVPDGCNTLRSCELSKEPRNGPTWVPDWSRPNRAKSLKGTYSISATNGKISNIDHDGFRLMGHSLQVVHVVETLEFDQDASVTETIDSIRKIKMLKDVEVQLLGYRAALMAVCRILCADTFRDSVEPVVPGWPSLSHSSELVRKILTTTITIDEIAQDYNSESGIYLSLVRELCTNRSLFRTDDGFIGLGPGAIQSGDLVVVILGCDAPLIFRQFGRKWQVVGECYVDGLMHGEAFFGPLPANIRMVKSIEPGAQTYNLMFRNLESGEMQGRDPRLYPAEALSGCCEPEELMQRGVALQYFELA